MERYHCIIFANAYSLTEEQRKKIRICTAGKHIIWMYAPGYNNGTRLDVQNISAVTGLDVHRIGTEHGYTTCAPFPSVHITDERDYDPLFSITGGGEPLAVYDGCGEWAAARRNTDWYFAFPLLNAEIMASIFSEAGVHQYTENGDPVLAGNGLLAVNCIAGGEQKIRLKNGKMISVQLPPYTTALFDAESGIRLL